jgi:hypothetical protein
MPEPQTDAVRRRRGGPPPAPPATGEPLGAPDPADPGPPIEVRLNHYLLGDLGNARVDARLLSAIFVRDGRVAAWLRSHGVDADAVEAAFPGSSRWYLPAG